MFVPGERLPTIRAERHCGCVVSVWIWEKMEMRLIDQTKRKKKTQTLNNRVMMRAADGGGDVLEVYFVERVICRDNLEISAVVSGR